MSVLSCQPGEGNINSTGGMKSRAFATNVKLWEKKIVPYKIDQSLSKYNQIFIVLGLKNWCLTPTLAVFQPYRFENFDREMNIQC